MANDDLDVPPQKMLAPLGTDSVMPTGTMHVEHNPMPVTSDDLKDFDTHEVNKRLLLAELKDYDLYQRNLHTAFGCVLNTRSLIDLVDASLRVHRQRRAVIQHFSEQCAPKKQKEDIEYDVMGNPIKQ